MRESARDAVKGQPKAKSLALQMPAVTTQRHRINACPRIYNSRARSRGILWRIYNSRARSSGILWRPSAPLEKRSVAKSQ